MSETVESREHLLALLELLERLIKLSPEGGPEYYRELEAEAYFRKGNVAKAIEIEAEVVRKHPDWSDSAETLKRFKAAQQKP